MSLSARVTLDGEYLAPGSGVVVTAPLADQVFTKLRAEIISGELPPGHRLRVREVAEAVGTSVMPVRIAIRQLVEAGLADQEPYKGARVRGVDPEELEAVYDMRILLESEGARLGALNADDELVERMERMWQELEQAAEADDPTEALHLDERLLGELYRASGNMVLVELIRGLWDRSWPYKVLWTGQKGSDATHIWRFKPELIAAARSRNGDAAQQLIRHSYETARTAIRDLLSASS